MKPTWIIADTHAGGGGDSDAALLATFRAARAGGRNLLLMGDLFLGWLAPQRFWTPFQTEVLEALRMHRSDGHRVDFVVGNRDYLVRETLEGTVFDRVYAGETLIELDGQPTWIAHGDQINPKDWKYRVWRRVSRSRTASALALHLPEPMGGAINSYLERRLSGGHSSSDYSDTLPVRHLHALAQRARANGAGRALLGHFHIERTLLFRDAVPVFIAPGWFVTHRLLEAQDGQLRGVGPLSA
jgi:UDP-2,3-diacylglucosamine hydrolase